MVSEVYRDNCCRLCRPTSGSDDTFCIALYACRLYNRGVKQKRHMKQRNLRGPQRLRVQQFWHALLRHKQCVRTKESIALFAQVTRSCDKISSAGGQADVHMFRRPIAGGFAFNNFLCINGSVRALTVHPDSLLLGHAESRAGGNRLLRLHRYLVTLSIRMASFVGNKRDVAVLLLCKYIQASHSWLALQSERIVLGNTSSMTYIGLPCAS